MANPNPNRKGLLPKLTPEAMAKGPAASLKRRRRQAEIREVFRDVLSLPMYNSRQGKFVHTPKTFEQIKNQDVNVSVITAMLAVQVKKALKGDTKAFEAIIRFMKNDLNINMAGMDTTEVEDVEALASMLQLIPKQENQEEDNETEIISDATIITNSGDNDGH